MGSGRHFGESYVTNPNPMNPLESNAPVGKYSTYLSILALDEDETEAARVLVAIAVQSVSLAIHADPIVRLDSGFRVD